MADEKSYRQIFKATSLFGGVQLLVIIFSIVRTKFIALWLGPEGIGIIGIFTSAITLIYAITGFGVGSSAVRNISQANSKGDIDLVSSTISTVRKLSLLLGFAGLLITLLFSNILSEVSFDSDLSQYTLSFMLLSIAIFFMAWENGEAAILQGLRKLKYLAKARVISSLASLVFSLPLFYYYGLKGIVPSLIMVYLFNAIFNYMYSRKIVIQKSKIDFFKEIEIVKDILKLGGAMALSSILVYAVMFVIRTFIGKYGDINDVGFYVAAFAILNGYVGLIFTAMAKDYYPRLSEVNDDNELSGTIANQQIEIGLLILLPIISILIVTTPLVIKILYSSEFLTIKSLLYWSLLGIPFKMISWSFSYVILSKGDTKSFLTYEVLGNITIAVTHIFGYKLWGLDGLGYAFLFSNFIYFILVYSIIKRKYLISLSYDAKKIFIYALVCALILILIKNFTSNIIIYSISIPIVIFTIYMSFYKLSQKMNFSFNIINKFKFFK